MPGAAAPQDRHITRLLANQPAIEHRWGRPCRAFLLCLRLSDTVISELSRVQEGILRVEPSLLTVPPQALHASAAWLISLHAELSDAQKEEMWRSRGPLWQAGIAEELRSVPPFRLRYRDVVATDSAIIAVARPADQVNALRASLRRLGTPGDLSAGNLVHTTLFRYARPFRHPARLLQALADSELGAELLVTEFLIIRERVFPSLERDVISRIPLQ